MSTITAPTLDLGPVIETLKGWEGFESFQVPGKVFDSVEREYKVADSAKVRANFEPAALQAEIARGDHQALRGRLRTFMKENGFSNLLSWMDGHIALKPLVKAEDDTTRIIEFSEALLALYGPDADIKQVAERMAFALMGADAAGAKGHMWAVVSYLAMMIAPDRYTFVKPSASNEFFKRVGSTYKRPKPFSGRAYEEYMARCHEVLEAFASKGMPVRDMFDLQSVMWIVGGGGDETGGNVYEMIREAVQALAPDHPGGVTAGQIRDFMDQRHPRGDGRPWSSSMVIPGDFSLDAETLEPSSPSAAGDPNYPKFLVRTSVEGDYRYRLAGEDDVERPTAITTIELERFFEDRMLKLPAETLANYLIALKTKPFVILTGISGTGKTKIAQLVAEYMCPPERRTVSERGEDTDTVFYVQAASMLLRHYALNVSVRRQAYFPVPVRGESVEVPVRFEGIAPDTARITNLAFANPDAATQVRLTFKAPVKQWIQSHVEPGDWLRFELRDGVWHVEKPRRAVHETRSDRYAFIPVRPDWTDNRGLLGYYNPITERYVPTELLKLMVRAAKDEARPYFVVLDEMNLARVEHYFSDFLSCLESRRPDGEGGFSQEPLVLHHHAEPLVSEDENGESFEIPATMPIPRNLYFTGTVNVDETTYMFSPKVLDRANTIEFDHVDLDAYAGWDVAGPPSTFRLQGPIALGPAPVATKSAFDALDDAAKRLLADLNRILLPHHLHFGYRVANEIALYLAHADELVGKDARETALDLQILQKVLPKFHGSRAKLEKPLLAILRFCVDGIPAGAVEAQTWYQANGKYLVAGDDGRLTVAGEPLRFPRTAAKVRRMLEALHEQGYASFVV